MTESTAKKYSVKEEIANSITHGIGFGLSVVALVLLMVFASIYGDAWHLVSFGMYGASLVVLYLFSTLYHSFRKARIKSIFRMLDHSAVFLLIAGTYTPFALVTLRGVWGWSLFAIIWSLAITGIVLNSFYMDKYKKLLLFLYVSMGWIAIFAIKPIIANLSTGGMIWLFAGGFFYTVGVAFYVWHKLPYNHAVWHIFVLAGSICHFFGILFHVLPL